MAFQTPSTPNVDHSPPLALEYRIAIICALQSEAEQVRAVFDTFWADHPSGDGITKAHNDPNHYTTGTIGVHNVVLAHMPSYGNKTSAAVASGIRHSFPDITLCLVVGICGGVPTAGGTEILLGDVIISDCIIENDLARQYPDQRRPVNTLGYRHNQEVQGFLNMLQVNSLEHYTQTYLNDPSNSRRNIPPTAKPTYLGFGQDKLFESNHRHKHHTQDHCSICDSCSSDADAVCEKSENLDCETLGCYRRKHRNCPAKPENTNPRVHFGKFASGDVVMKSGKHRDELANGLGAIAFEMEGAGVCRTIPCVIIKAVCDYADSHKNKEWQGYAAATAAACMKAFLKDWRPSVGMMSQVLTLLHSDPRIILKDAASTEMMQSLFVVDPPAIRKEIEMAKGPLLSSTGSWIYDDGKTNVRSQKPTTAHSVFSNWWTDNVSHILWIRGDPGKGKTMLAISLIDELQRRLGTQEKSNTRQPSLAYFFCAYDDEVKRDASYIVRSLLWQLLSQHPDLTLSFRRTYDTQAKDYLFTKSPAALSSLLHVLDQIVNESGSTSYFVVDALDECSPESRDTLLKYLEGLNTPKKTGKRGTSKWVLTSRNNIEISSDMSSISLEANANYVENTIAEYVEYKVQKLASSKQYPDDIKDTVQKTLSEKAKGSFLWIALIYEELRHVKSINIPTVLEVIPAGLPQLYNRMLDQILDNQHTPEDVPHAMNILRTITMATRPLSLQELAVAANLPKACWDNDQSVREYISLCGSFVNLNHVSDYASLIHPSVRDYLLPSVA
ncbi:Ff.00g067040.m01.CDS01 [Fusarium sp. VM40]|nr:Ff.00g067040.m01.CDS01 [Fusarium sp. VM40]